VYEAYGAETEADKNLFYSVVKAVLTKNGVYTAKARREGESKDDWYPVSHTGMVQTKMNFTNFGEKITKILLDAHEKEGKDYDQIDLKEESISGAIQIENPIMEIFRGQGIKVAFSGTFGAYKEMAQEVFMSGDVFSVSHSDVIEQIES